MVALAYPRVGLGGNGLASFPGMRYRSSAMYTIVALKKALGLATTNQVRNRIEAIKDALSADLRRGPNNQILVTEAGLETLRGLQALCDTGLRLAEASEIIASKQRLDDDSRSGCRDRFARDEAKPNAPLPGLGIEAAATLATLAAQVEFLRERVASLERASAVRGGERQARAWWEGLKEDADGA